MRNDLVAGFGADVAAVLWGGTPVVIAMRITLLKNIVPWCHSRLHIFFYGGYASAFIG
jgi:hypothetical protein